MWTALKYLAYKNSAFQTIGGIKFVLFNQLFYLN